MIMGAIQSQEIDQKSKIPNVQHEIASSNYCPKQPHQCITDWSDLPVDILGLILTKLPSIKEAIHLSAVCKSWRSVVPLSGALPRPPWIFMDDECIPKTLTFFSLDLFNYIVDIGETEGMQLVGTTYKHMVVLNEVKNSMYLLNPITKKLNSLPKLGENCPRAHHVEVEATQSEELVVIIMKLSRELVLLLCRPGDTEWRTVEIPYVDHGHAYYRGMYYVNKGSTMVVDLESGETAYTVPPPAEMTADKRFGYLIEHSGELFGLWKNKLWCESIKEYRFEIYKLENRTQPEKHYWIKMNGIGDRILFLNSSTGFCFKISDFSGYKENCIYFISARFRRCATGPREEFFNLCKYDIKTGKTEELKPVESILGSWFFPSLQ